MSISGGRVSLLGFGQATLKSFPTALRRSRGKAPAKHSSDQAYCRGPGSWQVRARSDVAIRGLLRSSLRGLGANDPVPLLD